MRILHVNHRHGRGGGTEVYVDEVSRLQRKRGHDVGVFAASAEREASGPELRVVRRPEYDMRRLVSDPPLAGAFEELTRSFRPDVVHVHNLWSFPADFALALRAGGAPVVQTVHDLSALCPNGWCVWPDGTPCEGGPGRKCFEHGCEANFPYVDKQVLAARLRLVLARRCFQAFLCPSAYVAERCRAHGFPDVRHFPNYAVAGPVRLQGGGLPAPEAGRILYVGRLAPEKGVIHLLEALPAVVALVPDARLVLAGGGPEEARLRARAAELGVTGRVELPGPLDAATVEREIARAGVVVLPSIWIENAPLSALEALVAGRPLVATAVGGLPELVVDGETGLLCRPRDAADLAEKLARVLGDAELAGRLSRGARARAARYPQQVHLHRLEQVYGEVHGRPAADGHDDVDADLLETIHRIMGPPDLPYYWKLRRMIDFLERTGALPLYRRVFHRKAPGA